MLDRAVVVRPFDLVEVVATSEIGSSDIVVSSGCLCRQCICVQPAAFGRLMRCVDLRRRRCIALMLCILS